MVAQKPYITTNLLCYKGTLKGHDDNDEGFEIAREQIDTPCCSLHSLFFTESVEQVPGMAELRTREENFLLDEVNSHARKESYQIPDGRVQAQL